MHYLCYIRISMHDDTRLYGSTIYARLILSEILSAHNVVVNYHFFMCAIDHDFSFFMKNVSNHVHVFFFYNLCLILIALTLY